MLKLQKIALTGGLGCGKSTVCRILKELGAYVVDADEIVHEELASNNALINDIINLLGVDVMAQDKLDRHKIAQKVFQNPKLLSQLERLVHPIVFKKIEKTYENVAKEPKFPIFVAEIPLFFEAEDLPKFDHVIVVTANETVCKQRTKMTEDEFARRMTKQLSLDEKIEKADFVIYNNGTFSELEKDVREIYKKLSKT